jgi:hypothetical protein
MDPNAHLRAVVVDEPHRLSRESGVVSDLTKSQVTAVSGPVDEDASRAGARSAENLAEQPEKYPAGADQ